MPQWRDYIPKEQEENLRFRLAVLRLCRDSKRYQRAAVEMCRQDVIGFIDLWVFQVNPRHVGYEIGPFICWPYQEAAIRETLNRNLVEQDDMLWEKSREMGATWMALIMDLWGCLFHDWRKYLWISHSEQAVDRPADPDSLFWKVDFILKHLPSWMTVGVERRKLGFSFGGTSSSMNGAASTGRSGVGGRATKVGLDEFSKQQQAREILGQTADTGPRLFIGTHYGVGTEFYNLTQRPDMRKIVMHWTQHPEKNRGMYRYDAATNKIEVIDKAYEFPADYQFIYSEAPLGGPCPGVRSPWYDKECARRANPRDIAMHLDIDPQGSQSQFFNPLLIRSLINSRCTSPSEWDLEFDPALGKPIALTPRDGGLVKLWCTPLSSGQMPRAPYGAGTDVSHGTGATNSTLSIVNARNGEKVCEVATPKMKPHEWAPFIAALCRLFLDEDDVVPKLCVETPGPGQGVCDMLQALRYGHLHFRESHASAGSNQRSLVPGWVNTPKDAMTLMIHYNRGLEESQFINRSEWALKEALQYRHNKDTVEHPGRSADGDPSECRVNHGDRVMADALAWKMVRSLQIPRDLATIASSEPPHGSLAWRMTKRTRGKQLMAW